MQKNFVVVFLHMKKMEKFSLKKFVDREYQIFFLSNCVLQLLNDENNYSKDSIITNCVVINNKLPYRNRLYVFDYHDLRVHFCRLHHDSPHAGHLKIGNIYK